MKKKIANIVTWALAVFFCLALSLALGGSEKNAAAEAPVRVITVSDTKVNAVSVKDVKGVMRMTAVNYSPNDFAELGEVVSNADTGKNPAKRGTYRFYIDTLAAEEWGDAASLDYLLKADGNWHLTMYIPFVFSACSVYVQYQNKFYIGSIDRYNVSYYTGYSDLSEFDDSVSHIDVTEPLFIDIPVSPEKRFSREISVTVHYETDNDNFVGIPDGILIGEEAAVKRVVSRNRSMLLIGAIIGVSTLLLFLFICVLKRSLTFFPQLLFAMSVFCMFFSTYCLFGHSSAPYFLVGARRFSVGLTVFSSALYIPKKAGKIPVLYPVCVLAAAMCVLAFVAPFAGSVSAYRALNIVCAVSEIFCVAVVFGFTAKGVLSGKPAGFLLNGVIAGAVATTDLFSGGTLPFVMRTPTFWLCFVMLAITIVLGFREFISAEIRNRYLTTNLEKEVEKQTQSLQNVLSERDKILLYVSHDMKKTVVGIGGSLSDLRQNASDPEILAKVDFLLRKTSELKKDFADLGKYGRQNYVAEQSEILDLSAIVRKVTDDLRPDCEANGIILSVTFPDNLYVYAKKAALESVILNLVLNAIEHSFCTRLSVSATKRKGMCRLEITDDGRGVATDKNIFEPFVSGEESENNSGLGLFLAKNAVESMHGKLTYERKDGLTIFSATLPLA